MLFVNFAAGNEEYRLRLNTANIVTLEKQIGCNPLAIFGADGDRLPTITEMVSILFCSLQALNHNITLPKAYSIFDNYLADGHSATDFLPVIMEVYKVSGIIQSGEVEDSTAAITGDEGKNG